MRRISIYCLSVSLLIDLFSGVPSYSSEGIISSYNQENYFSGKVRLRRVDNSASPNWDETVAPEIENEVKDEGESYMEQDRYALQEFRFETSTISVKTYVHVVYKQEYEKEMGKIDKQVIQKQIKVLNDAFSGSLTNYMDCYNKLKRNSVKTPFEFVLEGEPTYKKSEAWHDNTKLNYKMMTQQLRKGGCGDLNIFITGGWEDDNTKHGNRGYGSNPSKCSETSLKDDFVVIGWDTLPDDASTKKYNDGFTLVHHVGHWLGLYDTYQGGCSGSGDFVSDTPAETGEYQACEIKPQPYNSCKVAGQDLPDPVTNFMHSTRDCCAMEFTVGQVDRMISQSKKFRFKDPSGQCSAKQKLAEIIVNANSPVQMVFYIATLPTNTGSESLEYPKNTPKTTTPVQVTPGKMFQECLDPKKTYLLVIMDSSGGLSKIDRYGKGSWELKWNGNTKKPQASYSRHVQTHLFGAPRSCDIQSNLFSVFVRTDANPEQTRWVLWNNTFPEEGFIKYTEPNVLTVWEKCIPEVKHSFSIYDSAADGFSAGPNDVGFYAVFLNGSLRGQEKTFTSHTDVDLNA